MPKVVTKFYDKIAMTFENKIFLKQMINSIILDVVRQFT